jgi:hypothetical protein
MAPGVGSFRYACFHPVTMDCSLHFAERNCHTAKYGDTVAMWLGRRALLWQVNALLPE